MDDCITISHVCVVCHQPADVTITRTDYFRWAADGEYAQSVWPEWSPEERELLISGTHPECWELLFPPEDEGRCCAHDPGFSVWDCECFECLDLQRQANDGVGE